MSEDAVHEPTELFLTVATIIDDPVDVPAVRGDPDDDIVLAVCRDASVDYLVTGDKLLIDLGSHHSTRIVTPRQFAEVLSA